MAPFVLLNSAARLIPWIVKTPFVYSKTLSQKLGAEVWLTLETVSCRFPIWQATLPEKAFGSGAQVLFYSPAQRLDESFRSGNRASIRRVMVN